MLRASTRCVRTSSAMLRTRKAHVLALNVGSSSIKSALFDVEYETERVQRVHTISHPLPAQDQRATALRALLRANDWASLPGPAVVSHRIVHGGQNRSNAALISPSVEAAIEEASPLAPLHNPLALQGVHAARLVFPDALHVAVFDTAFHRSLPVEQATYPIPRAIRAIHPELRRVGFHGISCASVLEALALEMRQPSDTLRVIVAHLGSGASLTAIRDGHSVGTSMGMTPAEGLIMGTRAGDVDSGLIIHLAEKLGLPWTAVDELLHRQSGLKGMCGTDDMQVIKERDDEDAVLCRAMVVARIRKYLGACLVQLNGDVDALAFTGGIGEKDAGLRSSVCHGLANFGIELDPSANLLAHGEEPILEIGATPRPIRVFVLRADEERYMAKVAMRVVNGSAEPPLTRTTTPPRAEHCRVGVSLAPKNVSPSAFWRQLVRGTPHELEIVLPEGGDARVLEAARYCVTHKLCNIVVLGDRDAVHRAAGLAGLELDGVRILEPATALDQHPQALRHATESLARKMRKTSPRELLASDTAYLGAALVGANVFDGMVCGASRPTATTVTAARLLVDAQPDAVLLSSSTVLLSDDGVKLYADCALNQSPTARQLAHIAIASAGTAAAFGLSPRVALLSFATGTSARGAAVEHVREAVVTAKALRPDLAIDGPMQYDAAISPEVSRRKAGGDDVDETRRVLGCANVLVFPDLNAANCSYKAAQRSSKCAAIGPLLQGLSRPVTDLSRGCTSFEVVMAIVATCGRA